MKNFSGKVVVITGAGSGLGRSLALKFAQADSHLALLDQNSSGLAETRELISTKREISLHTVDVVDMVKMAVVEEEVVKKHRQVDVLINNAGITLTPLPFDEITPEQFRRVVDVNMWGVYNGLYVFLQDLKARPEAAIVNISSLAGLVGLYGYAPYVMSKFAVRGLTETLQTELVKSKVSLLIVHPGGIKTNLIKNAPNLNDHESRQVSHESFRRSALLSSDKAADKIIKAIHKKKRRLIIGPDAKIVNGIRTLHPGRFPDILYAIFSQANFGK